MKEKLKVFLCHSSDDKPAVREIYQRLKAETWIDPWLDEEELFPGQDWDLEIEKAVESTDAVLVFLSNNSVSKEGYVQRELRMILRISDYKPEGAIFTIPLRLEKCKLPRRLSMWQYVDLFPEARQDWAYKRLLGGLKIRAGKLGVEVGEQSVDKKGVESREKQNQARKDKAEAEKKARELTEQERIEKRALELAVEIARKEREARENKLAEEKAREEKEAHEKKFAEEKVRKEKEAQEKKVSEEKVRKEKETLEKDLAEEKARKEKEAREKKLAEEKARKAKEAREKKLVEKRARETARKKKLMENPAGIEWVKIPAGKFTMGSDDYRDEKPPHKIYLNAYLIAKTPVTNAQFKQFIEAGGYKKKVFWSYNGWKWCLKKGRIQPRYWNDVKWNKPTYPVVGVSWYEAEAFCKWAKCRLPSEAEWEKAARGTDGRKYPWGNQKPNKNLANFNRNVGRITQVGKYSPAGDSPFGCVDMAGNIWEWCADWYNKDYYVNSPKSNPLGPETGTDKVLRGGSWNYYESLRVSNRLRNNPDGNGGYFGFRCLRSL